VPLYPGQGAPSATTLASTGGGNKYGSAAKAEVRAAAVNNATAAARIAMCLTISSVWRGKRDGQGAVAPDCQRLELTHRIKAWSCVARSFFRDRIAARRTHSSWLPT